jgi:hypothetical protein
VGQKDMGILLRKNLRQDMKEVLLIFIILILSVIGNDAFAISQAELSGLNYLSTTQNPDGSWSGDVATDFYNTFTVLETFRLFNKVNASYQMGFQWSQAYLADDVDYLTKRIILLSQNNISFADELTTLLSLRNIDSGGWGLKESFAGEVIDTALALQALKAVNYSDQNIISSALGYLLSTQNTDGGWAFRQAQGDEIYESNVYMTALILDTLSQFKSAYNLQTEINSAASYLLAHQNSDGSFGSPTVYETALSLIALIDSGQGSAQPLQNAINYLSSTQLANGSWNDDAYSTALALRALANVKPNLSISSDDIAFSNPTPTVGETITITANVKNTGVAQADNVLIQFFDGDPNSGGVLIGETTIPSISSYSNSQTSISWTIPTASSNIVFVTIDPLNVIDELNEEDNTASKNLTSATLPDLSITSADITFNPSFPTLMDAVTVTATVRNMGETPANNVTIDIYDGDPASGGISLYTTTFPTIGAGNSATIQLTTNFTAGSHNIYVVIDKTNSITDSINNRIYFSGKSVGINV